MDAPSPRKVDGKWLDGIFFKFFFFSNFIINTRICKITEIIHHRATVERYAEAVSDLPLHHGEVSALDSRRLRAWALSSTYLSTVER
jgi:hypothetical protein